MRNSLYTATETYFNNMCNSSPGKSEPKILENIHRHLCYLRDSWKSIFHGKHANIEMYSLFIHKSPLVLPISRYCKSGIEFGDLLFIHTTRRPNNKSTSHALLLQAKLLNASINKCQLDLYTSWPEFSFSTKKIADATTPNKFNLPGPRPHNGARYLFIDTSGQDPLLLSTATPHIGLNSSNTRVDFINEILDLLNLNAGRELIYPINDDWTRAIDHVFEWAKEEYYGKSNLLLDNHPRIERLLGYLTNPNYDKGIFERALPFTRSIEPENIEGKQDEGFMVVHILSDGIIND
ncbi:hypothetical protein [Paenibacillus sp. MY03]|uniref:hypothetical protein n=1 Tax=Paenibacillus sp. MY03 TaxID=302980 RepID=UPI00117CAEDE|nr:hypothetical protein [Paenibacillus sp. MY03]